MNGNIIVVDDETNSLKLLKELLTEQGYKVRPFTDGELALRSMQVEMPDLVLLDVRMPILTGFEVCQRIKTDENLKDIPVIFISAADEVEDKLKAFNIGGVDYITKPFHKQEVLARVKTHVTQFRTLREIKEIDQALRKSEQRLKIAEGIAQLGHWEWNIGMGQIYCSEQANSLLGDTEHHNQFKVDEFLLKVHPDDRERVIAYFDNVMKGIDEPIEYRILLSDGQMRVVIARAKVCYADNDMPKIVGTLQESPNHTPVSVLGVLQDITERKKLEWRLEKLANTDVLTGCINRRHFFELAETEFSRIRRYNRNLSVLMLDLDHFKQINDTYGHAAGDKVLIKLVELCNSVLRDVDKIGRLGGEEFVILLPETYNAPALIVAERLCRMISETTVESDNNITLHFTASIGVATANTADSSIDMVLNRADKALYQAKQTGRNRVCS